jgi:hypothetical protein
MGVFGDSGAMNGQSNQDILGGFGGLDLSGSSSQPEQKKMGNQDIMSLF